MKLNIMKGYPPSEKLTPCNYNEMYFWKTHSTLNPKLFFFSFFRNLHHIISNSVWRHLYISHRDLSKLFLVISNKNLIEFIFRQSISWNIHWYQISFSNETWFLNAKLKFWWCFWPAVVGREWMSFLFLFFPATIVW